VIILFDPFECQHQTAACDPGSLYAIKRILIKEIQTHRVPFDMILADEFAAHEIRDSGNDRVCRKHRPIHLIGTCIDHHGIKTIDLLLVCGAPPFCERLPSIWTKHPRHTVVMGREDENVGERFVRNLSLTTLPHDLFDAPHANDVSSFFRWIIFFHIGQKYTTKLCWGQDTRRDASRDTLNAIRMTLYAKRLTQYAKRSTPHARPSLRAFARQSEAISIYGQALRVICPAGLLFRSFGFWKSEFVSSFDIRISDLSCRCRSSKPLPTTYSISKPYDDQRCGLLQLVSSPFPRSSGANSIHAKSSQI
jgi:hypothetical protein